MIDNRWLHGYALFVAIYAPVSIATGAGATACRAGVSKPDWPVAYGQCLPFSRWLTALELLHTAVWALVTSAVIRLRAIALREHRRSVKWLEYISLGLNPAQVSIRGAAVLLRLPTFVSAVDACLCQLCFGTLSVIASATGPSWTGTAEHVNDHGWPMVRAMVIWTPILVFIQILLGSLYRRRITGAVPHIVSALFVAGVVILFSMFVLTQFPAHETLKRAAIATLLIVFVQVMLGVFTYMIRLPATDERSSGPLTVFTTVAHVSVGGVLFVASILFGLEIRRNVLPKAASIRQESLGALR